MSCKSLKKINVNSYLKETSFKEDQIWNIYEYFCKFSSDKLTMNMKEFRMSLGVLGAKSCDFIFRRIFELIDGNKNMKISFDKYIQFLNLVNYGTNEDKLAHSFKFFDIKNKGVIDLEDFKTVILAICEFFSIVSTTPMKICQSDIEILFKEILLKCEKKQIDFQSFLELNNQFPELLDFFDIFNYGSLKSSVFNIKKERLSQLDDMNRKLTILIQKCGIYCETNRKITLCPKSLLVPPPNANSKVSINEEDNLLSKTNDGKPKSINWKKFTFSNKMDNFTDNLNCSDSSLDWDLEDDIISEKDSEVIISTENNKKENNEMEIDFPILKPYEPKNKALKPLVEELNKEGINLNDCLIIPNKTKFIEYLEKIRDNITEIIKEVDPQKQKITRRQGIAIVSNDNTHAVDKEFFLNIPFNRVDSTGLIHFGNSNVELVLNMMIGIRSSINAIGDSEKLYDLSKNDDAFKEYNLFNYTQNIFEKETKCQFYDYAPKIFFNLRKLYRIKNEDYLKSLGPENFLGNLILIKNRSLRELVSAGKSGSFFYFSYDSKFVLKTISEKEFLFFQSILKDYYNHMLDHKNTLLQRFFGLHIMYFNEMKMHFVIMNNVFLTNVKIHYKYDLKGSLYQRISRDPRKKDYDDFDFNIPMKDLDLLDRKFKFNLTKLECETIINQIQFDTSFLASKNINDYSFLIGIHDIDYNGKGIKSTLPEEMLNKFSRESVVIRKDTLYFNNLEIRKPFFEKDRGGLLSSDGKKIYFIGIIDIFTEYGAKKKAENIFKSIFQGPDISCKPPIEYYERFYNFMKKIFDENAK